MQIISTIARFLGGLLLLLYPFVMLADLMGLAAIKASTTPLTFLDVVMVVCLYYGTLVYPVVYIPCWILAKIMRGKDNDSATFVYSILPLVYLIIIGIPIVCLLIIEGHKH